MVCRGQQKRKKLNASGWAAGLSLLITLLSFSGVYSSDNKWDIKIELSKQDYVLHEPVLLDVTLTNNTSDTLRTQGLTTPNHYHFYIFLTDGEGREMKYTGPHHDGIWEPGELLLGAGEQDYNCLNLPELFEPKDSNSAYKVARGGFPFIPKGTYTVMVEYEGDHSDELRFNIIEPYGQEEEVLRKIEQASKIWSQADAYPAAQVYGGVPKDYPNSAFAEQCYYLFRFYSQEFPRTGLSKRRTLRREMLSNYPNSGNVRGWLSLLTFGKNEDETIAIYSELMDKHPNTRCSKIAGLLKKRLLAKREAGKWEDSD